MMRGATPLTMTSVEIAELTGKRHDNVMADIRKMLVEIQSPEKSGDYQDGRGRTQPCLLLDKDETLCLVPVTAPSCGSGLFAAGRSWSSKPTSPR